MSPALAELIEMLAEALLDEVEREDQQPAEASATQPESSGDIAHG